jgi:hypothetical protein
MSVQAESLRELARAVLDVRDAPQPRTPVLVKPAWLILKQGFLVALCDALLGEALLRSRLSASQPPTAAIQLDWIRGGPWSTFTDPIARIWAARIAAHFHGSRGVAMEFQVTATISRPRGDQRVVVGICNDREALSPWTRPIYLATTPADLARTPASDPLQSPAWVHPVSGI